MCERHFLPDYVIKYFDLTGPDGVKSVKVRERPILASTAVPNIFLNLPKYLTKASTKRKVPTIRKYNTQKKWENLSNYLS